MNVGEEIEVAKRNSVTAAIERLASQPWFARTLLFIAFFALITESSAPGLGVAGFISGLCFLLFFWCQFLNGTSGWLEVTLFIGGLVCIALEIFVLPGFGVFGLGGGAMVLTSIVLASQTFIIPRNSYQYDQMPNSLFTAVVAGGGVIAAAWIVRRYLPDAPVMRLFMLRAPDDDEVEEMDESESLVDWQYLSGKRGVTTTQLTPSGKANFGDEVIAVISDGVLIQQGVPILVIEVRGNRILVEPLEEG